MKKLAILTLLLLPVTSLGAEDVEIPVITNFYSGSGWAPTVANGDTKSIVNKIGSEKIANTIKDVKNTVCGAVEDGDIKVYFTFDAEGKVFGIGASTGAGIEVTFNCISDKSP